MISAMLAAALICQDRPGPVDAFRANYSSTHLYIDYQYTSGVIQASALAAAREARFDKISFQEDPDRTISGEWECDGQTERYRCGSTAEVVADRLRRAKPGEFMSAVPPFELLFDGERAVFHQEGSDTIVVIDSLDGTLLPTVRGPFLWWSEAPFPNLLKRRYPGVSAERFVGSFGGIACECEVYRNPVAETAWDQLEVAYDPSAGFIPSRCRRIFFDGERGVARVREMYVVSYCASDSGGVVPLDWFEFSYSMNDFTSTHQSYRPFDMLAPSDAMIGVGHFVAQNPRATNGPVALKQLEGINRLGCPGGEVALTTTMDRLTIKQASTILGGKLSRPRIPAIGTIDHTEISKYNNPTNATLFWPVCGLVSGVALVGLVAWRRRHAALIFLVLTPSIGCDRDVDVGLKQDRLKHVNIKAEFAETSVVIDDRNVPQSNTLRITNLGSRAVKVFDINGDCTCRKIDTSALPIIIGPAETQRFAIVMADRGDYEPQNVNLTMTTDYGTMVAPATFQMIPRHRLSPDTASFQVNEGDDDGEFVVVHREVYPETTSPLPPAVDFPEEFRVHLVDSQSGNVGVKNLKYIDRSYSFRLIDKSLGVHVANFIVKDRSGAPMADLRISWVRSPYLSTTPERVTLGVRKMRVFLKCPDESVEFSQILKAPDGVSAIINSPREITVSLLDNAPNVIQDTLEVSTTATDRPSLKIPVIRYSLDRSSR